MLLDLTVDTFIDLPLVNLFYKDTRTQPNYSDLYTNSYIFYNKFFFYNSLSKLQNFKVWDCDLLKSDCFDFKKNIVLYQQYLLSYKYHVYKANKCIYSNCFLVFKPYSAGLNITYINLLNNIKNSDFIIWYKIDKLILDDFYINNYFCFRKLYLSDSVIILELNKPIKIFFNYVLHKAIFDKNFKWINNDETLTQNFWSDFESFILFFDYLNYSNYFIKYK